MLSYEGIFFEADMDDLIHSLETEKLAKINEEIRCTFNIIQQLMKFLMK